MFSEEDGALAVALARDTLDAFVTRRERKKLELRPVFREKRGAFVTVNTHPAGELRGCIGYPSPLFPLEETLVRAAEGAAEDPRFPPLSRPELDRVTVEVSLLTPPEELKPRKPQELPRMIVVGRDGLVVAKGRVRGVLLPQVAVDWSWDSEMFLTQVCLKAGLPPDAWLDGETILYAFRGELFAEDKPHGRASRRDLVRPHAGG